ncbi:MAG TPA: RNA polymerase sigma factor [Polyangiaceae bacterium]|nr:RNA polymerase sigma factor [Polyangiaceae bacterium]
MRVQAATLPEQEAEESQLKAAEVLYRQHYGFVWRNARRLGATDDWVDDAVHEVFLVATRRLTEFEGRSSAKTWLFAITFRIVQRLKRDRSRRRQHDTRYERENESPVGNAAEEGEAAEYLRYLLGLLPDTQRVILILVELEGFTSAAVAESLGIPAGTVDSRLRAARAQLAKLNEREKQRDERWQK